MEVFDMNQKIYFDNGSTSWPKAPQVASSMSELLESGASISTGEIMKVRMSWKSGASHTYAARQTFSCAGFQTCHIHTGNHLFPELSDQRSPETRRSRTGQQPGT